MGRDTTTGEWKPDGTHPAPADIGIGNILHGVGAPDDTNGDNGDLYVDTDAGTLYQKSNDTWGVVTGSGGGGIGEVHYISTAGQDPNSHVTATRGAIAYDNTGAVWLKTGSGNNNTGWEQRL